MHRPTDHQCLAAARRALAEHLATRPATPAELAAQASAFDAQAEELQRSYDADLRDRGLDRLLGQDLGRLAAERDRLRAHAQTYHDASAQPLGEPWEETRRVLTERVRYYSSRIEQRRPVSL